MNDRFSNLYQEFLLLDLNNPENIVSFFEMNNVLLQNKNNFEDSNELQEYFLLYSHYINSLYTKGYFQKVVENSERLIKLYEKHQSTLKLGKEDEYYYLNSYFFKGISFFNLKHYKESSEIFKFLIKKDDGNSSYRNWYKASRNRRLSWLNWIIMAIGFLCIILLEVFNFGRELNIIISIIGFSAFLLWAIIEIIRGAPIDKMKNLIKKHRA